MDEGPFAIRVTLREGYRFEADFQLAGVPPLQTDEPPPLGTGAGPNPARLLAAAVGNCLGASLLFCLRKSRVDVQHLVVQVTGRLERNPRGRLRIAGMHVALEPHVPADQRERVSRCTALFEDFCLVTESVRHGMPVDTTVQIRSAGSVPAGEG